MRAPPLRQRPASENLHTSGHTDGASGSAPGDNADHRIATKLADFQKAISCDQLIHSADDSHGQRFHAISTLAPLRALWARTPVPAWARHAVGECVKACPKA